MNVDQPHGRLDFAKDLTREAGEKAKVYFLSIGDLIIQQKGAQDLVSNADLAVETFIQNRLVESYPDDMLVNGGRVIAFGLGVFDKLPEMANAVYTS